MEKLDISLLKKHPHIYKTVELLWGSKELYNYVNKLLLDTRDGQRTGFHPEVAKLLNQILELHFNEDKKSKVDWFEHL